MLSNGKEFVDIKVKSNNRKWSWWLSCKIFMTVSSSCDIFCLLSYKGSWVSCIVSFHVILCQNHSRVLVVRVHCCLRQLTHYQMVYKYTLLFSCSDALKSSFQLEFTFVVVLLRFVNVDGLLRAKVDFRFLGIVFLKRKGFSILNNKLCFFFSKSMVFTTYNNVQAE